MSYEFAEGSKIRDQASTHFLTFTVMGWIDIFSRTRYRDIIIESFKPMFVFFTNIILIFIFGRLCHTNNGRN